MFKKTLISLATVAMVAQPIMPSAVQADSGSWSYIQATAAWTYDDYKVERLDFGTDDFNGPLSLGDNVVVAKAAGTCASDTGCERYDLYVLRDGMAMFVGNVPHETVDEQRFYNNGEELVYINSADADSNNYWEVVSLDLATGEKNIELEKFFMDGIQDADVMEGNGEYFINASLNWNDHKGFTNAVIYQYDQLSDSVKVIAKQWTQQRDEIQDVKDGKILSKMVFESGFKQLWVYDTMADPKTAEAVPNTWTEESEDIVGAHFRTDGTIEFFDRYQRFIYDGKTTVAQGDSLSWYHSYEQSLQVVNGRMAWLDPEDGLHVSGAGVDLDLGTIGYPQTFTLTDTALYYSSGTVGKMYDFATKTTTTYPFAVTDALGSIVVGEDTTGNIWYLDTASDRKINLGFGSNAVISDDMHVYWYGSDNHVYEATLSLHAMTGTSDVRAVKVSGSSRVYLVLDDTSYWIQNEKTYFSWFDSWNDVETISSTSFNALKDGGDATYAPGTRLKMANDPKVYMVGSDGKLHWITTQLIAYNIFGQTWNKGIVEFNMADTTQLQFGSTIDEESDVQSI
ncbi:MAG: hypothetical protein WC702_03205 [Patescibacteria group bacterium]|jgi:hypothetical protein